jgi:alpha-methylacyl-CoA racemase
MRSHPPLRSASPRAQPLRGRVILDCSTHLPGPSVGKLLAQEGARVIKVENPHRPDPASTMGALYNDLNEMKERVALDLTRDSDRERFRELVRQAHGLIEGFRPKAKAKLGLDAPTLHAVNPALCILSLVGYPEDGPWRDRAGHDLNFAALTGAVSLFQEMPALPLADLFASYEGAFRLAAALDAVSRGAPGTRIVVSMTETLLGMQSGLARDYRESGGVPGPGQMLFAGGFPCYRLYETRNGRRVSVGAIENKFWVRVCEILGLDDLAGEGYATGERGREVAKMVSQAFARRDWEEWAPLFANEDCCVEPVLDYSEVDGDGV